MRVHEERARCRRFAHFRPRARTNALTDPLPRRPRRPSARPPPRVTPPTSSFSRESRKAKKCASPRCYAIRLGLTPNDDTDLVPPASTRTSPSEMNFKINNGFHESLDSSDTAPPPLPPWLKGFLVTSRNKGDMRLAGEEIAKLCNDDFFKLAYDDVGVPRSMVKPGETEVPYDFAEALLVPGCPGSVFVALRPDDNTVNVRLIAEELIEEADKVGAAGWTKTSHTARLIPVESIAPEYDIEALAAKMEFAKLEAEAAAEAERAADDAASSKTPAKRGGTPGKRLPSTPASAAKTAASSLRWRSLMIRASSSTRRFLVRRPSGWESVCK